MAALERRPYFPCVPRSLDVKVLQVITRIFHIVQCKAFKYTQWQSLLFSTFCQKNCSWLREATTSYSSKPTSCLK